MSSSIFLPSIISYIFLSFLRSAERFEIPLPCPNSKHTSIPTISIFRRTINLFNESLQRLWNIPHQFFIFSSGLD
ncbi:hypothetical protein BY996DRAFT_6684569 [Phakopsora pachyrhizi]|nr:hypothetical protein BY996DRAFT_6684569 [Phakopsora pachyrhizi]